MGMPQPPLNSAIENLAGVTSKIKTVWQTWFQLVQRYLNGLTNSGPTDGRPTQDLWVGQPYFDTTLNAQVVWNGSTWVTSSGGGSVTAVTGTAPIASSGGATPNISISQASVSANGYLSSFDWNAFNNKVASVSATSPVVSSGGSTPVISMPAASATTNGYLTSLDWNRFNTYSTGGGYVDVYEEYGATYGRTAAAVQQALTDHPGRTLYLQGGPLNPPTYPNFWTFEATVNINTACSIVGDGEFTVILPGSSSPAQLVAGTIYVIQSIGSADFTLVGASSNTVGVVFTATGSTTGSGSVTLANSPLFLVNTSKPIMLDNFQILGNNVTGITGIQLGKGYAISGLSWAGGTVTLTTSTPHNIPVGDYIYINVRGASPIGYNYTGYATSAGASTMTYAVASNPGTATVLGSMAVENAGSRMSRLNILACPTGIYCYQAGFWTLTSSWLHDCSFASMWLSNALEPDHGDVSISDCQFGGYGTTGMCIYQTGLGGVKIVNNKFINGSDHWKVAPGSNIPINDAIFSNNSTENAAGDHVHIDGTNGTPNNFIISNNQFGLDGDKTSITGINIIGTSVNSPTQTIVTDNLIWVHGTNQTGINVNAGGFDQYDYCTIYVVNNNLYQWGQSVRPADPDYRTGQTAIAIQGTASVHVGANNINGIWANRFIASSSQQCRFDMAESGTVTLVNLNVAPVGPFYATGWQPVSFPVPFPVAPSVNVVISGANGAGAVTLLIQNVTTTGFDLGGFCINTSGTVVVSWQAFLTGQ